MIDHRRTRGASRAVAFAAAVAACWCALLVAVGAELACSRVTAAPASSRPSIGSPVAWTAAARREPVSAERTIAAVQGRGHVSPLDGQRVAVRGIVTALDADPRRPGFWLQAEVDDGDPATAEGLRVDTAGVPALEPGDLAAVSGKVVEGPARPAELRVTRLVEASWRIVERGRTLPPPVVVTAPPALAGERSRAASRARKANSSDRAEGAPRARSVPAAHVDDDGLVRFEPDSDAIDFFESLEGMRVSIEQPIVVGPTNNYRECVVLAGEGAGSEVRSWRGGLVARPGDDDPERILVDPRLLGEVPRVAVGDVFAGPLVGVLDYAFGSYRVLLTETPPPIERPTAARDRTRLRGDAGHLTVATWNVLDLGNDDGDGVFRGIARGLVEDLGAPDLVALQEISDASGRRDDGSVDGKPTLDRLVAAIRAAGGPAYEYLQIDPRDGEDGGPPGANIRVALLFDPSRVSAIVRGAADAGAAAAVLPGPVLSSSPGRVEPFHQAWRESRKPLAAELRFGDRPLFVVANHFTSKLGDDPLFGSTQPPIPWSERKRREQAALVGGLAASLLREDPGAAVIVLGDLNEHWFGPALAPLVEAGLVPLVERVPLPERYTYNYRGRSQVLDHIFVSASLAAAAEVDIVHTNADFPAWRRASDHDAVVARLRVR
ncbi:MAG TPA: endonuclease/exonuclease/phosphatase family protein [Thermoanaerobaculia bacterium]|nr:endonuclease/exonuclease/phosphatase family protein [Thermoanaerobaculia bacterium]